MAVRTAPATAPAPAAVDICCVDCIKDAAWAAQEGYNANNSDGEVCLMCHPWGAHVTTGGRPGTAAASQLRLHSFPIMSFGVRGGH
jgi:hypothetical protein